MKLTEEIGRIFEETMEEVMKLCPEEEDRTLKKIWENGARREAYKIIEEELWTKYTEDLPF